MTVAYHISPWIIPTRGLNRDQGTAMNKHYYLSQFIGSGTQLDPFQSLAARFGPSGMLDLRPDETRQEGWCFTCVECEDQISVEPEAGLIYLGDDGYVDLSDSTINQIKECLLSLIHI